MKTYTHVGEVKRTDGQIKKYHTMFTDNENAVLRASLKGMKVTMSNHAKRKNIARSGHIKNALKSFDIIEFNHNTNGDCRVLLRGRAVEELEDLRYYNLCLVVSLTRAEIVTVYYNYISDSHTNINMNRYSNFGILDYM